MSYISDGEVDRQYRVLKQNIDIYASLRDSYTRKAFIVDITLIIFSVILCSITFLSCDFLTEQGFNTLARYIDYIKIVLSVSLFCLSLISLKTNWKALSARNSDAVQKCSKVLAFYRRCYNSEEQKWDSESIEKLHDSYGDLYQNIIAIPSQKFIKLKNKYLRKLELSKLCSKYPGFPLFLLRLMLLYRTIKEAKNDYRKKD